jgi:hypothetical protein
MFSDLITGKMLTELSQKGLRAITQIKMPYYKPNISYVNGKWDKS